ncbi:MAG: OmpA family protein, partial [Saprospiraceae bacterium]|nr:OmpA family protein [Saprospiraceae bacterium]
NGNLDDYLLQNQRVPDRNLDLAVTVTDKVSGQIIPNAEVRVLNYDANTVIGRDENGNLITIQKVNGKDVMVALPPDKGITGTTDAQGRFLTEVKPGNYVVIVSKEDYQTKQLRLAISKPGNELTAALEKSAFSGKVRWNASVFNYVTNAPLAGAMLVLTNQANGSRDTVIADANGLIDHHLERTTKYRIDLYQGGRHIGTTDINTEGWSLPNQIMMQNFSVAPLMPGTVIELPNIYYNFNDATLRPDARKDLDLLVSLLKQQPSIKIELASHTDCRGSSKYNQELSQRRADGVVEYLIEKGIARDRLSPVGYGESEPRNQCRDGVSCTEQEHARNRRTEVRILTGIQGAAMVYVDGKPTYETTGATPAPAPAANAPATQGVKPGGNTGSVPNKNVNTAPPLSSNPVVVSSGDEDQYYVIAGSFQEEERAKNHLKTLQEAGYAGVKIVRFPNSPYHSVCVNTFSNRQEAYALKRKLDQENIDSFVRAVPKTQ